MKVSFNWLRSLVDIDYDVQTLAHKLTMAGLEVEEIHPVAASFKGVVIAEVRSVSPHPNADKLRVTEVDAGQGGALLQIVCGAPNVAVGMRVPCAMVGAVLPGIEIKAAKLRGVESNGMLCSAKELGLSDDHGGLLALDSTAQLGQDIRAHLDLDDVVLTLKITPNRGDCLSMLGIARDLAAMTGATLKVANARGFSDQNAVNRAQNNDSVKISLAADSACPRYVGRSLLGLDPQAVTPEWMKRRLERGGFRPISPLVDITNYVNLAVGQPMHAFDRTRLTGDVQVRWARLGESITLLNDQVVELTDDMLVIADASGPIALAGVMGGKSTMVTDDTKDVFFESAFFAPDAVKGRARRLGLSSDAAFRFERGVDPNLCVDALALATELAVGICGTPATTVGPPSEASIATLTPPSIPFRLDRAERLIGLPIAPDAASAALVGLNCAMTATGERVWLVTPPSYRFDLTIEEDLVEEVIRLIGYESIPATAPRSTVPMLSIPAARRSRWAVRHAVAAHGYQEVINYSFVDASWEADFCANTTPVALSNPIASQMSVMRTSLLAGLCHSLAQELNRGQTRGKLFEVGRCFLSPTDQLADQPERLAGIAYGERLEEQWAATGQGRADFFSVKGELQTLLAGLKVDFERTVHPALHPGRSARLILRLDDGHPVALGVMGELHPRLQQKLEFAHAPVLFEVDLGPLLDTPNLRYQPISRQPAVRRDIAVTVAEEVEVAALLAVANGAKPPIVAEIALFDLYRGSGLPAGQKSLAFRIVMQDTERTLTDVECDTAVSNLVEVMHQKYGATLRK